MARRTIYTCDVCGYNTDQAENDKRRMITVDCDISAREIPQTCYDTAPAVNLGSYGPDREDQSSCERQTPLTKDLCSHCYTKHILRPIKDLGFTLPDRAIDMGVDS